MVSEDRLSVLKEIHKVRIEQIRQTNRPFGTEELFVEKENQRYEQELRDLLKGQRGTDVHE